MYLETRFFSLCSALFMMAWVAGFWTEAQFGLNHGVESAIALYGPDPAWFIGVLGIAAFQFVGSVMNHYPTRRVTNLLACVWWTWLSFLSWKIFPKDLDLSMWYTILAGMCGWAFITLQLKTQRGLSGWQSNMTTQR